MSAVLDAPPGRLRPMTEIDLDAVIAIELEAYPHPWTRGIFRDCLRVGYCCWVYEHAGEVAAYAVMSGGACEAHLLNLCVSPGLQGQGMGRMMLAHLLELARGHEAEKVFLEVRPSNYAALGLYESMGFTEVGRRKAYYPADRGKEDAIIMVRII